MKKNKEKEPMNMTRPDKSIIHQFSFMKFFMASLLNLFFAMILMISDSSFAYASETPSSKDKSGFKPSYLVSCAEVMRMQRDREEVYLIDVRSADEFAEFSIPESMNMPLYSLSLKKYLRNAAIIIISKGYERKELISACEELSQKGFRPMILNGGLNAWKMAGGSLSGTYSEPEDLMTIDSSALFREMDSDGQIIICISCDEKSLPDLKKTLPKAFFIGQSKDQASGVEAIINKKRSGNLQRIVLVGDNIKEVRKLMEKMKTNRDFVFFGLSGGHQAILAQAENRMKILSPESERMVSTKACAPCEAKRLKMEEEAAGKIARTEQNKD